MHWDDYTKLKDSEDLLYGNQAIADFLQISLRTYYRMVKHHDFPIVQLDTHRIFTTKTALRNFINSGIMTTRSMRRFAAGIGQHKDARGLARNGSVAVSRDV